jgi:galactokinase
LSASAALEISVGLALTAVSGLDVSRLDLALSGQRAEHDYVGTRCGIMDQYVVAHARENHALLIDCRALESQEVPLELCELTLVVCDTRTKHELAVSEYNQRRAECEQVVAELSRVLPEVRALRDVGETELELHQGLLSERLRRRARHVVTENARTLAAAAALRRGDVADLGGLMRASH